jgi:hypothetical protein
MSIRNNSSKISRCNSLIKELHGDFTQKWSKPRSSEHLLRVYSLFTCHLLSSSLKLTFHKALTKQVKLYACLTCEFVADIHHLKFQNLQNNVLRTTGKFPRCTAIHDFHTYFNLPYVYDYKIKLCRLQAEVIRNHENEHIRSLGQGLAKHRKYKSLKLGDGQAWDRSSV